jgi:hypothetical protein
MVPGGPARTSAHLAPDVGRCGVTAGHSGYAGRLARHSAALVLRAVADEGVPAGRDRDREGAARADRNVQVNVGPVQYHPSGPGTRQPGCRAADAVQVPGQGALGGALRRARGRERSQAQDGQAKGSRATGRPGKGRLATGGWGRAERKGSHVSLDGTRPPPGSADAKPGSHGAVRPGFGAGFSRARRRSRRPAPRGWPPSC